MVSPVPFLYIYSIITMNTTRIRSSTAAAACLSLLACCGWWPSRCQSFGIGIPVVRRSPPKYRPTVPTWRRVALTDDDQDDQVEPSVESMVQIEGDGVVTSTSITTEDGDNPDIFGLTAAMATATATTTPLEETIRNVQTALLSSNVTIVNSTGQVYQSPQDLAPLLQGHRVAFYFGAGWCPACRELEFMLPQYMLALQESAQPIALIYVSSDHTSEFMLDRMQKCSVLERMGVSYGDSQANALKAHYGIWAANESSQDFAQKAATPRRSGIPALIVLDTNGQELAFLNTERDTIAALGDWPLDDPKGIF